MRARSTILVLSVFLATASACGDDGGGGPGVSFGDGSAPDLSAPDAGAFDAADGSEPAPDTPTPDAEADAGPDTVDAGPDAVDVGPDAGPDTVDAGPDTVDAGPDAVDAGPDVVDAGPDTVAPGGDLPMDPTVILGLCNGACEDMADACDAGPIAGSVEACRDSCVAEVTDSGWHLASWACYAEICEPGTCQLGGEPPTEDPLCTEACAAFDGCDMMAILELPEDQPNACRAACAGTLLAEPQVATVLPCMIDAMDPACDAQAAQACFGGVQPPETACPQYCAPYYEPQGEQTCAPDSGLREAWPTQGDCAAVCEGTGDGSAALRFFGCTLGLACADPAPCQTLPQQDDGNCQDACDAMFDLCGQMGGLPTTEACASWCTGLMVHFGGSADKDADKCIDDLGACPATQDEQGAEFIRCSVPRPAACETICEELAGCPGEDGEPIDPAECEFACATGALGPEEGLDALAACMENAPEMCTPKFMCFQSQQNP